LREEKKRNKKKNEEQGVSEAKNLGLAFGGEFE
jgi:hypothetical protein